MSTSTEDAQMHLKHFWVVCEGLPRRDSSQMSAEGGPLPVLEGTQLFRTGKAREGPLLSVAVTYISPALLCQHVWFTGFQTVPNSTNTQAFRFELDYSINSWGPLVCDGRSWDSRSLQSYEPVPMINLCPHSYIYISS